MVKKIIKYKEVGFACLAAIVIALGGFLWAFFRLMNSAGNATMGTVHVYDGAVLIGSYAGGAWTPSASDVTPCYVGADSNGASAAQAIFAQLQLLNK